MSFNRFLRERELRCQYCNLVSLYSTVQAVGQWRGSESFKGDCIPSQGVTDHIPLHRFT